MGTSNFHMVNAQYTVTDCDEFTFEDVMTNVRNELENDRYWREDNSIRVETELRSFPASSIGEFTDYVNLGEIEIEVTVLAVVRSGYYEGFNLDYEVNLEYEYSNFEDPKTLIDDIYDWHPSYRGAVSTHRDKWIKRLQDTIDGFTNRLEEVYSMYSDETRVIAVMSNGETIYERVDNV